MGLNIEFAAGVPKCFQALLFTFDHADFVFGFAVSKILFLRAREIFIEDALGGAG